MNHASKLFGYEENGLRLFDLRIRFVNRNWLLLWTPDDWFIVDRRVYRDEIKEVDQMIRAHFGPDPVSSSNSLLVSNDVAALLYAWRRLPERAFIYAESVDVSLAGREELPAIYLDPVNGFRVRLYIMHWRSFHLGAVGVVDRRMNYL